MTPAHPGEMIAMYINSQELNITELAKQAGMSRVTFYAVLKGKLRVSPRLAVAFEEMLGLEADQLLENQAGYDLWQARIALQEYRTSPHVEQSLQMSFAMA